MPTFVLIPRRGRRPRARVPVAQLILLAPMIPTPGETAGEWWENTGRPEAIADVLERRGPVGAWA